MTKINSNNSKNISKKKKSSKTLVVLDWTLLPITEIRHAYKMLRYLFTSLRFFFFAIYGLFLYLVTFGKIKTKSPKENLINIKEGLNQLSNKHGFFSKLSESDKTAVMSFDEKHMFKMKFSMSVLYFVLILSIILLAYGFYSGASIFRAFMLSIMVIGFSGYCWIKQTQLENIVYAREQIIKGNVDMVLKTTKEAGFER